MSSKPCPLCGLLIREEHDAVTEVIELEPGRFRALRMHAECVSGRRNGALHAALLFAFPPPQREDPR
jgi:hypothetical protein